MKSYTVIVAPIAAEQIAEYGRYLAEVAGMPQTAERWVNHVYDMIATLKAFPNRYSLAEEDRYRDYKIRRQVIGNYLVLYTVDEEAAKVHVVGFRHGHRLPRPSELPQDLQ